MDSPIPEEVTVEFDAERIRSSVSTSIDNLEKLTSELEQLQDFLKSETERVRHQIEDVMSGIQMIMKTIAPWKTTLVAGPQNTHENGRDRFKRRPLGSAG